MSFNQKLARTGQDFLDAMAQYGLETEVSYDADKNLQVIVQSYVTATDANVFARFMKVPQLGNNQSNPVTGLVEEVFTPHVIQVEFGERGHSYDDVSVDANPAQGEHSKANVLLAGVVAGDTVVINGVTFDAIAGPYVANQDHFHVGATDAETALSLVDAITYSLSWGTPANTVRAYIDTVTPEQVDLWAFIPGIAGDAFTLADGGGGTFTPSGATFALGVDGDSVSVGGGTVYIVAPGEPSLVDPNIIYYPFVEGGATDVITTANLRAKLALLTSGQCTVADAVPATATTFRIYAKVGGAAGDFVFAADAAGTDISLSGVTTGSDFATDLTTVAKVLAEVCTRGSQVDVYTVPLAQDGVQDFADFADPLNIAWSYRNLQWGNLSHM